MALRHGNADLWPVLLVGAGIAAREGRGGAGPNRQDGSLLGAYLSRQDGARQRSAGQSRSAGQFSRWGPPTGIARERETRTDDAAPRQSHGCEPTHRQPRRIAPTAWSAGQFSRRRSPTGIARERETRGYDADPGQRQCHTTFFMRAGRTGRPDHVGFSRWGRHRYEKRSETASCWTPGCFRRKNPVPRPRRAVVRPA